MKTHDNLCQGSYEGQILLHISSGDVIWRNPGESYVTIVYGESHSSASNTLSSTYRKAT